MRIFGKVTGFLKRHRHLKEARFFTAYLNKSLSLIACMLATICMPMSAAIAAYQWIPYGIPWNINPIIPRDTPLAACQDIAGAYARITQYEVTNIQYTLWSGSDTLAMCSWNYSRKYCGPYGCGGIETSSYVYRVAEDKFTIALSGDPSVEPWHKKKDKEHTNANLSYRAIVKDQNGQPKANVSVTITTDVISDSGGHAHTNGRPKGKLVVTTAGVVSTRDGKETLAGTTDANGVFEFTFGAEEASGEHNLKATCLKCKAPANATVNVAIQGLMLLNADPLGYTLRGSTGSHPDNHYFSSPAIAKIIKLAHGYKKKFGKLLLINDSSLIEGGLFDITGQWTPSHKTHRRGTVVDINNYRTERDPDFEQLAKDCCMIKAVWEDLSITPTPHYHLVLLGENN